MITVAEHLHLMALKNMQQLVIFTEIPSAGSAAQS